MQYKDIIAIALQSCATTAINIHPIDGLFIMEIDYDIIIKTIVDDLNRNGYTIIQGSSSDG